LNTYIMRLELKPTAKEYGKGPRYVHTEALGFLAAVRRCYSIADKRYGINHYIVQSVQVGRAV